MKPCLTCHTPHGLPGPRCKACQARRDHERNRARRDLYGPSWKKLSARARALQPWCSICGRRDDLTLDHEHRQVECRSCNSSHRRNPA